MLSQHPKVSVVIPTLFREKHCVLCVEDLMKQDYDNFEVIIVEQEVRHPEVMDLARRFPEKVSYYFGGEVSTMPRNRNIGVSHATGEIISFLDDDCRLPEDFLSKGVEAFLSEPGLGAVSPKIVQPREALEVAPEGFVGRVSSYGKVMPNYGSSTKAYTQMSHGCSFFLKQAFDEVGGFDELFVGNAMREESDFSMRIAKKGYKLLFEPRVEFIHVKAPMGGTRRKPDRMDWYFDFFHNDFLFFLKNLKWRWMPVFFLSKARPILACMFYYGKGKPRALALPFKAYFAGYKTYKSEQKAA